MSSETNPPRHSSFFPTLWILLQLVRRDYVLQYAGTGLGISWILFQNWALVAVFSFVFLGLGWTGRGGVGDSLFFVLSGLMYWIPLQEYILRLLTILSDNRNLIKRSSLGTDLFLWIPTVQFVLQFLLTSIPMLFLFSGKDFSVSIFSFLFGFGWIILLAIGIRYAMYYLAHANIILKDLTPVLRLVLQFGFWTLPILYQGTGWMGKIQSWNPLSLPLEIFRTLLWSGYQPAVSPLGNSTQLALLSALFLFVLVSILLTKSKFKEVVLDQL